MSNGVLIALIILLLAVLLWRPLRRLRTALGLGHLLSTGHAFLIAGATLRLAVGEETGPEPLTRDVAPIVAFVAGWVGFATGMRFDGRVLRTVPARAFAVALTPALTAAAAVGGTAAIVFVLLETEVILMLAASTVIAAAAAGSGPTLVAVLRGQRAGRAPEARSTLRMVEFSAGMGDVVVVLLAVVGFALFRNQPEPIPFSWLIAITIGGAAVLGAVTWLFLGGRPSDAERMLLGLAMLAFIAGFANWLLLSPAAVAAIAAAVAANLPGHRMEELFFAVRRVERPAVVILMTVAGFHIAGGVSWIVAPLVGAMTLVRLAAKYWTGQRMVGPVPGAPGLTAGPGWAGGLTSQSILGLMIALSFLHVWQNQLSRDVLGAVAIASLINELATAPLLLRLIRRQQRGLRSAAVPGTDEGGA